MLSRMSWFFEPQKVMRFQQRRERDRHPVLHQSEDGRPLRRTSLRGKSAGLAGWVEDLRPCSLHSTSRAGRLCCPVLLVSGSRGYCFPCHSWSISLTFRVRNQADQKYSSEEPTSDLE